MYQNVTQVIANMFTDAPRIIPESSSASHEEFSEGSTPELKCYFSGVPTPTVRWFRGSRDAVGKGLTLQRIKHRLYNTLYLLIVYAINSYFKSLYKIQ